MGYVDFFAARALVNFLLIERPIQPTSQGERIWICWGGKFLDAIRHLGLAFHPELSEVFFSGWICAWVEPACFRSPYHHKQATKVIQELVGEEKKGKMDTMIDETDVK
ncbi:MAG: hypothetical protein GX629_06415 [Phycisphaerae bacterium]|nr:hypothetical protein [Phycisphaerae bacterium]